MKAHTTTAQDDNKDDPSPSYNHRPQVSSVYTPRNRFNLLRPQSAPLNDEDF